MLRNAYCAYLEFSATEHARLAELDPHNRLTRFVFDPELHRTIFYFLYDGPDQISRWRRYLHTMLPIDGEATEVYCQWSMQMNDLIVVGIQDLHVEGALYAHESALQTIIVLFQTPEHLIVCNGNTKVN